MVLHHVPNIGKALTEIARILKPSATLTILDMISHEKTELQKQMGHKHLGFSQQDLHHPAFQTIRWIKLPKEESALGPALFVTQLKKTS